jgi:hypothetical protein
VSPLRSATAVQKAQSKVRDAYIEGPHYLHFPCASVGGALARRRYDVSANNANNADNADNANNADNADNADNALELRINGLLVAWIDGLGPSLLQEEQGSGDGSLTWERGQLIADF